MEAYPIGQTPTQNCAIRTRQLNRKPIQEPIVITFYLGYKFWFHTPFMRAKDMDLQTGMRELNLPELLAEERAERAAWPRWKKAYKLVC